jgi:peptidoglycan/LPS O-acetylase OafA/YrhL
MNAFRSANAVNIDVLRGVAAVLVVLLHAREIFWVGIETYWHSHHISLSLASILGYGSFPMVWGSIGVPIFFVLSGYCIHRGYAVKEGTTQGTSKISPAFFVRRFVRIYPVLLAALFLTLILDSLTLQFTPDNVKVRSLSLSTFLINLFAFQGIAGTTYGSNGALWTLSLEIQFYLCYPLLFKFLRFAGRNKTFLAVAAITLASHFITQKFDIVIFSSYWLSWYIGAYIADLDVNDKLGSQKVITLSLSIVLLLTGCLLFFKYSFLSFQSWSFSFASALTLILRMNAWRGTVARIFQEIGKFSYSLYIIHLPFLVFLMAIIFDGVRRNNITWALLATCMAIIFSFLFYVAIERPVIFWLSRRSNRQNRAVSRI